jgi:hypothetical protein
MLNRLNHCDSTKAKGPKINAVKSNISDRTTKGCGFARYESDSSIRFFPAREKFHGNHCGDFRRILPEHATNFVFCFGDAGRGDLRKIGMVPRAKGDPEILGLFVLAA